MLKFKFSKTGQTLIAVLAVAILAIYFFVPTKNAKPPQPTIETGSAQAPPGADQPAPPPPQPPPPAQEQQQQNAYNNTVQAAANLMENIAPGGMDLLQDRLGRDDPFEPLHASVMSDAPMSLPDEAFNLPILPPMTVENPPDFRLSAIAVRDAKGIAIINGEIVGEGDYIGRYMVKTISAKTVALESMLGEKTVLTIQQGQAAGFSTSSGVISNVSEKPKDSLMETDGFINVSPRLPAPQTAPKTPGALQGKTAGPTGPKGE